MNEVQLIDQLSEQMKIVTFHVDNEEYGFEVLLVNSIEKITGITRVPNVKHYIIGVMNLRGSVIPIVDLRKRFNLLEKDYDDETRIIILEFKDMEIGIVVDRCSSVTDINRNGIEAPPKTMGSIDASYIQGAMKLDDRLIILLDIEETIKDV